MNLVFQSPSIGRIVRYMDPTNKIYAALVVAVTDHDTFECRLAVYEWDQMRWVTAPYSAVHKPGYWSWPGGANVDPYPQIKREGKEL